MKEEESEMFANSSWQKKLNQLINELVFKLFEYKHELNSNINKLTLNKFIGSCLAWITLSVLEIIQNNCFLFFYKGRSLVLNVGPPRPNSIIYD